MEPRERVIDSLCYLLAVSASRGCREEMKNEKWVMGFRFFFEAEVTIRWSCTDVDGNQKTPGWLAATEHSQLPYLAP